MGEIIKISDWKNKREVNEKPVGDDRMARIKQSLEQINNLMAEIKQKKEKTRPRHED